MLSDVVEHLSNLLVVFGQERVFMKTTCSPRDPPNDLSKCHEQPSAIHHRCVPKMTFKPTHLIRNENIQSTATTCSVVRRREVQENCACIISSNGIQMWTTATDQTPSRLTVLSMSRAVLVFLGSTSILSTCHLPNSRPSHDAQGLQLGCSSVSPKSLSCSTIHSPSASWCSHVPEDSATSHATCHRQGPRGP